MTRTLASLAVFFLLLTMLSATPAQAGGGSSITLNPTYSANPGHPQYGSAVNFTVSTTRTTQPWVSVTCWQNGSPVYQQSHAYYQPYLATSFDFVLVSNPLLDNYTWSGGGAECTAVLWYISRGRGRDLASTSFTVLP